VANGTCRISNGDCSQSGKITAGLCGVHYTRKNRYGDPLAKAAGPDPLPGERWRDIQGYEGLYQVSDFGRIWSFRRKGSWGHFLKPSVNSKGYPGVTLSRNDVDDKRMVHRLVAEAFMGPLPPGQVTRHGRGRTGDPSLANLSYGTPEENEHDKIRDGVSTRGERNGQAKLTEAEVLELRSRYGAGESSRVLGEEFGLSRGYVSELADGRRWGQSRVTRTATAHVRGTGQHQAKLTDGIVAECRRRRAAGETYVSLAREFGVTKAVMREAVLGITWKHVA
jgi:hypothetical protein